MAINNFARFQHLQPAMPSSQRQLQWGWLGIPWSGLLNGSVRQGDQAPSAAALQVDGDVDAQPAVTGLDHTGRSGSLELKGVAATFLHATSSCL